MKHFFHFFLLTVITFINSINSVHGQVNSAKVYWVGHSLVDGKNWSDPNAKNLIELMTDLTNFAGKNYDYHRHTIPGAPIGWNWGVSSSWAQVQPMIAPLTNPAHSEYGTFDVMVVTEGVNLQSSYDSWSSSFYARKFFNAAKNANPNARLFLYESWHHYNAGDFQNYYGPQSSFNWRQYMIQMRSLWETIADEAADPAKTAVVNNYVYQGSGADPGNSNALLKINIIPTGKVLVAVLDRILEQRSGDNWTYNNAAVNQRLSGVDFFQNPLLNFPSDLSTTVHGGNLDDIHASPILIYLNALTHYAVIYGENPANLPTAFGIPTAIATIFKEVVWDVVSKDPRTGLNVMNLSINAPANNTTYLAPATIPITATATGGNQNISKVEFYNGTVLLGSDNSSPYSFAWTNVSPGTYTITAKAFENTSLISASAAVTVKVNANQNPTVSITAPVNNATFVSPANITITATAADADGTIAKVEFYNGTTLLGTDNTSPYAYNWTGVAAGTYTITAKTTDDKNATTTSSNVIVIVNNPNQAPSVSITSPVNNATYIAPSTITITATATDDDGTISKVEFYNGTALLGSDNNLPYSFAWTNVSAGTYTITAKAFDNLNMVSTSAAVAVKVNANQNPTISITAPANNTTFVSPANITISATAADADGTVSKVEFYNGTTLLGTDNTSPYAYNWTEVAAGTYTITAKATDDKNGTTTSAPITVIINENQSPIISITAPANNAVYMAPANVTVTTTASDADGSISKVEFYQEATKLGESTTEPYTFNWSIDEGGIYTIKAVVTDNLGKTGEDIITIKIETPVTVVNNKVLKNINLYPNPTQGILTISEEIDAVSIKDLSGKELDYIQINEKNILDLSNYTTGVYLIEIIYKGERNFIRVIKE